MFRDSDVLFDMENEQAILMSETDTTSAEVVLKRIQEKYAVASPFRYALVCYPQDGMSSRELIEKAEKMVKTDRNPCLEIAAAG